MVLLEFTNTMFALMGRVEDMNKCIKELESTGEMDQLHVENQTSMSFVVAEFLMLNSKLERRRLRLSRSRLSCTRLGSRL